MRDGLWHVKRNVKQRDFLEKCSLKLTWETNLVSITPLRRRKYFIIYSLYSGPGRVKEKEDEEEEVA